MRVPPRGLPAASRRRPARRRRGGSPSRSPRGPPPGRARVEPRRGSLGVGERDAGRREIGRASREDGLGGGARLADLRPDHRGIAEDDLGLRVGERQASRGSALPRRRCPDAPVASQRLATERTPRRQKPPHQGLLDDLHLQPRGRLGDLAGDRGRALLRGPAERVGLLRREPLAALLLRAQLRDVAPRGRRARARVCALCCGSICAIDGPMPR